MKKSTLFAIVVSALCLVSCHNKQKKDDISQQYKYDTIAANEREIEYRKEEYKILCFIGEDRWLDFDNYYKYISIDSNEQELRKELIEKGYTRHSLYSFKHALKAHEKNKQHSSTFIPKEMFDCNEDYVAFVFVKLKMAGINMGYYPDFKNSLEEKDGFIKCFDICCELGIVNDWKDYVSRMYEPSCDNCLDYLKYNCEDDLQDFIIDNYDQYYEDWHNDNHY